MVPNDADKDNCVCCEALKPGATAKKTGTGAGATGFGTIAPGGGFKFVGASTGSTASSGSFGSTSDAGGKFKFGAAAASTDSSIGGFKFGSSNTSEASAKKVASTGTEEKGDIDYYAKLSALNQQVTKMQSLVRTFFIYCVHVCV